MASGLTRTRLIIIALLALAAHVAALWWAHGVWQPQSRIKLMAEPIYARLLQPKEPARAPQAQAPQNAAPKPRAVSNSNAIASRPLPQMAAPKPATAKPPPPAAKPKVAAAPKAPPKKNVYIPPPPKADKPLFAALDDDAKYRRPEPEPMPSPLPTEPPLEEFIDASPPPVIEPAAPASAATSAPLLTQASPAPSAQANANPISSPAPTASPNYPNFGTAGTQTASSKDTDVYREWPDDTRINLKVSGYYRGDVTGSAKVTWQREKDVYQSRVDVSFGIGGFTMTSQGKVTPEGLTPDIFEEKAMGRIRSAKFEPDTITIGNGKRIARAGLPNGMGAGKFQDSASQFVELSHRFATGKAVLMQGATVDYWLGRPEGLYQYVYDINGPVPLDLPKLGKVNTYHLVPRPIPGLNKEAIYGEIWIAPSLQYLPVKIRMRNDAGAHLDMLVDNVEQADRGAAAQK